MGQIISLIPEFELISGDDALTLPLLSIGGCGIISVITNIIPQEVVSLVRAFNEGNLIQAQKIHYKLLPLIKTMFIETNPIPVKTAAGLLGLCSGDLRLPMCEMEDSNKLKLEKSLKDFGLTE
jgi:4-hydroxy-tetrahydrodipicolinate synthase